jgi:hypothetical protein
MSWNLTGGHQTIGRIIVSIIGEVISSSTGKTHSNHLP